MKGMLLIGLVLCLVGCSREASGPVPPRTREEAAKAFDEAITRMNWAQVDYWKAGGRDLVVSVQIDTSVAPNYFRLPRRSTTP